MTTEQCQIKSELIQINARRYNTLTFSLHTRPRYRPSRTCRRLPQNRGLSEREGMISSESRMREIRTSGLMSGGLETGPRETD